MPRIKKSRTAALQSGFTLLEAVVSLALIASAGVALYGLIHGNILSLNRVQAAQQRNEAVRGALAFMKTVNPMLTPRGDTRLGAYQIKWEAVLLDGPKDGISISGSQGLYQLGLYRTTVELLENTGNNTQFKLIQAGYKQVRFPDEDL